jgi:tripartite-type tricarboxylate transporter receptor subunit TctC
VFGDDRKLNRRELVRAGAGALASAATLTPNVGRAAAAEKFFSGKVVTIVIGAGTGGFYDLHGRLIAQFLSKRLPFSPSIVCQNMPGASQLRATEYCYNIAPRDGSTLFVVQPYVILNRLLDDKLKFDVTKIDWIGRGGKLAMGGIVSKSSGVDSATSARSRRVVMGGNAANGPAAMIPWALNKLAATRFNVIRGYEDQTDEQLAMERNEIQGIGNGSLVDFSRLKTPYRLLYLSSSERSSASPGVPTINDLVLRDADKPVMNMLAAVSDVGLTLAAPPGVPTDRLALIRDAFARMANDPDYIAAASKLGLAVDGMRGAQLADFVAANFTPTPDLRDRLKAATAPEA